MLSKTEAIKKRRSVRTFDGSALTGEDTERILDFASKVENPYDIAIEWKILDAKASDLKSPVINGTDTYIAGKMIRTEHAEEAFGYTFEKVVLFAEANGIGTTWIAGTMNRAAFEKAMQLKESEVMPCVSPLGYPAKKMSLKESMMRKGVKADTRLSFDTLFYKGSFKTPLKEADVPSLKEPLELVRLAPSAVNKQPWRLVIDDGMVHFYEKRNKGYVDEKGWDIQKIDIGIAICHFEIGASEKGIKTSLQISDPGIEVPADTFYVASYILQ